MGRDHIIRVLYRFVASTFASWPVCSVLGRNEAEQCARRSDASHHRCKRGWTAPGRKGPTERRHSEASSDSHASCGKWRRRISDAYPNCWVCSCLGMVWSFSDAAKMLALDRHCCCELWPVACGFLFGRETGKYRHWFRSRIIPNQPSQGMNEPAKKK